MVLAISTDGGSTYRDVVRQEYFFSPPDTTFEHEDYRLTAVGVTHLRLDINPDKSGRPCWAMH